MSFFKVLKLDLHNRRPQGPGASIEHCSGDWSAFEFLLNLAECILYTRRI